MIIRKWVEAVLVIILAINTVVWFGSVNMDRTIPAVLSTLIGLCITVIFIKYGRGVEDE